MEEKLPKQLGLEKQMKKWGHLSGSKAVVAVYVYIFEVSLFALCYML